jgi:hypothetical protein
VGDQWNGEIIAALIAAAVPLIAGLGAGYRWLTNGRNAKAYERGWDRVAELEEEVQLLRIALHKATQRGNDGWTALEISLLAMPLPVEDRIRAVKQARRIIERTLGISL